MRKSPWCSLGRIALAGALAAGMLFPAGVALADAQGTEYPPPEYK